MDEKLLEIWTQGEIVEIFPFDDGELESGHREAIVVHDGLVYYLLVSADGQPLKINHIASDDDYDTDNESDAEWDELLGDGLEDFPWEEEEE